MDLSGVDYVGFKTVIDRGTAEIIEETGDMIFLRDTVSGAYMLAADDGKLGVETLKRHEGLGYGLIMTTCREAYEYARDSYGFGECCECFQFAYLGDIPEEDPRLTLRTACPDDLDTIMRVYDQVSREEMLRDIRRGAVMMAYDGGDLVGFMGEHLEGSLGMLYVFPKFRRKGYASALENAGFAKLIREGRTPFGQVIKGNTASMELQKKKRLTKADRTVYWVWKG